MWNHSEPNTSSGGWPGVVWQGHQMRCWISVQRHVPEWVRWVAHLLVGRHVLLVEWHIIWLGGAYWNGFWLGGMNLSWVLVGRDVHKMWSDYARHKMTMWDTRWLRAANGVCGEWQGLRAGGVVEGGKGMWNTKHEMTMWDAETWDEFEPPMWYFTTWYLIFHSPTNSLSIPMFLCCVIIAVGVQFSWLQLKFLKPERKSIRTHPWYKCFWSLLKWF